MVFVALSSPGPALAQFTQQGCKLVGSDAVGPAHQGRSVGLSADGNTAIVGGLYDKSSLGAAWIFNRSGGGYIQQGSKLVGDDAVGPSLQGWKVALSADGNTAIVGGNIDNDHTGAVWIYTRSGGVWTQQGPKLVGTGAIGKARQGSAVALSADGNTALVGSYYDNSQTGALWAWTRSGGVWTQQGPKLVGSDVAGAAYHGISLGLSADGNTAIVGGYQDDTQIGAAWIYVRSDGVWKQQGPKLVGTGTEHAVGEVGSSGSRQGADVAISADGNTAIVGGPGDNLGDGAAWVYTRSNGVWTQQGRKLVGTGAGGKPVYQGSVSLSGDGNTAIVGGYYDNSSAGAVWIWTRSNGVWTQQGSKLVGTGADNSGGGAQQGNAVALSADGTTAIVGGWFDHAKTGAAWVWTRGGGAVAACAQSPVR